MGVMRPGAVRTRIAQRAVSGSDAVRSAEGWSRESSVARVRGVQSRQTVKTRVVASASSPRSSPRWPKGNAKDNTHHSRTFFLQCSPNPREDPPRRAAPPAGGWREDTGIANAKEWGISLPKDGEEPVNESGINEDGSTWFKETGEDLGDNGYTCKWTLMGGRSEDGLSEWKETWWEKSDWSGFKELGAEKSGRSGNGDSWWETWQEAYSNDERSGLAKIERSAQKQAKAYGDNVWNEKWSEKYNSRGWTEKGAHKFGKSSDHSWWEKWGEQYDGHGAVLKWTDKWAERQEGSKWGDKWEERFTSGVGTRQGEKWHLSADGTRWTRTWGEEHYGDGMVHKYGRSSNGEQWDVVVPDSTYYECRPHYGWEDALANSSQLLSIKCRKRPSSLGTNGASHSRLYE